MADALNRERRLAGLMRAAQDGNGEAYAALLNEAAAILRRMIAQRLRALQRQDVEDLVQDTLLSLHQARATYDPGQPFMPWLMAIARHRMADGARRYARRASNEVTCDPLPEAAPASGGQFGLDDTPALAQAMARLPYRQQQAIELVKLREMSHGEAATITGTSAGAVKVALHRGIAALRRAMGVRS